MNNSPRPICPLCKSSNSAVKLTDLIFVKTHSINLENMSDEIKLREIADIELINQLMLPPEPKNNDGLGMWRIPLYLFGLYLFFGLCGSFFYTLYFLTVTLLDMDFSKLSLDSIAENPDLIMLIIAIVLAIVVGAISLIASAVLTTIYFKSISKLSKKAKNNSELKYPIEKQKWESAKEVWINLYYCSQDNIVFEPSTNQVVVPEETRDFVYNHSNNVLNSVSQESKSVG